MKSPPLVANGKTRVLRLCGVQWIRRRSEEILHPDFEALPAAPVEGIFWPSVRGLGETAAAATGPPPSTRSTLRLHRSGACLCGALARHSEIREIEQWFPDTAAELHGYEQLARDHGHLEDVWAGNLGPINRAQGRLPLCSSCETRAA